MLLTAVQHDGPSAIRYPRGSCPAPWQKRAPEALPIGRGETLRAGEDIAIVAVGPQVQVASEAAARLEADGVSAEVINARFVKPLDEQRICEAAERCGRMIVLEENALIGGFGSAVLEVLSEKAPECRVARIGVPDRFVEHNKPAVQLAGCGLTAEDVAARAREMCADKAPAAAK